MKKMILPFFFILFSCKTTTSYVSLTSIEKELLKEIVNNYNDSESEANIYYQSITSDLSKPISEWMGMNDGTFDLCDNEIDSVESFLNRKEREFLANEFDKQIVINFKKIKEIDSRIFTRNSVRFKTSHISKPILFRNNNYALYYSTETYGGEFHLMKKVNGMWSTVCSNISWIE